MTSSEEAAIRDYYQSASEELRIRITNFATLNGTTTTNIDIAFINFVVKTLALSSNWSVTFELKSMQLLVYRPFKLDYNHHFVPLILWFTSALSDTLIGSSRHSDAPVMIFTIDRTMPKHVPIGSIACPAIPDVKKDYIDVIAAQIKSSFLELYTKHCVPLRLDVQIMPRAPVQLVADVSALPPKYNIKEKQATLFHYAHTLKFRHFGTLNFMGIRKIRKQYGAIANIFCTFKCSMRDSIQFDIDAMLIVATRNYSFHGVYSAEIAKMLAPSKYGAHDDDASLDESDPITGRVCKIAHKSDIFSDPRAKREPE